MRWSQFCVSTCIVSVAEATCEMERVFLFSHLISLSFSAFPQFLLALPQQNQVQQTPGLQQGIKLAKNCTVEDQNGQRKQCQFPFRLTNQENTTFFGCTSLQHPDSELWCSTKVDPKTRTHIEGEGNWGYCNLDQDCTPKLANQRKSCQVVDGNNQILDCQFPFHLTLPNRTVVTVWGCTSIADHAGKLWCSTKVNETRHHVSGRGYWGYCKNEPLDKDCRIHRDVEQTAKEALNYIEDLEQSE